MTLNIQNSSLHQCPADRQRCHPDLERDNLSHQFHGHDLPEKVAAQAKPAVIDAVDHGVDRLYRIQETRKIRNEEAVDGDATAATPEVSLLTVRSEVQK